MNPADATEILKNLAGFSGVQIVQAAVEMTKGMLGDKLPGRFVPGVAILWAVIWNVVLAFVLGNDWRVAPAVGFVIGLTAAGLYQYGKTQELTVPK